MAVKRTAPPKAADAPATEPEAPAASTHGGWEHDWRNPDARFAKDDHCPNAELRRLAPR